MPNANNHLPELADLPAEDQALLMEEFAEFSSRPLVFLSSTSDLTEHREAIKNDPGLRELFRFYIDTEDNFSGTSSIKRCLAKLQRSQGLFCVVGKRFGTPFPDGTDQKSIVRWEYETARAENKHTIVCAREGLEDEELDPRQSDFVDSLNDFMNGSFVRWFDSPQTLLEIGRRRLLQWYHQLAVQWKLDSLQRPPASRSLLQMIALGICGLGCVLLAVLLVLAHDSGISTGAFVGICCGGASLIALTIIFIKYVIPKQ